MSSAASEPERLEINWFGAAGSALGAVSSAVLLSTLGAAGTLIGAALGSICITVGGAVYSHSLKKTKQRVVDAPVLRTRRPTTQGEAPTTRLDAARPGATAAETHGQGFSRVDVMDEETAEATPSWSDTLRELPWKRISILAGAVFALAITAILVFELFAGKPVSSYTGGTSSSNSGTLFTGGGGTADTDTTTDTEDGTDPQEQPTLEDGTDPQEQAPEDGEQPAEPTQDEAPDEQAPQDEVPQEQAPQEQAPQEQPAPEPAPVPADPAG